MDRLASMATFVKAADLGSFAAAAEATGMSATMVGKHVQFLESRLGVRLISRTTRRQSLTEFGRAYYDRCRAILAQVEMADAMASDHLDQPHGVLRVAAPALLGRVCVAPLLLDLSRRHPALGLDLSLDDQIVDLVAGAYDLGVRTGTIASRPGLMVRRLGSHRMLVCASPDYIADRGQPLGLEALKDHVAVMYGRPGWEHAWLFRDHDGARIAVAPPHKIRLNDMAAVADASVSGEGLSWLPAWLARPQLNTGALVEVLQDQPCYAFDNYALWPEAAHLPLRVRLALDVLASELAARLR